MKEAVSRKGGGLLLLRGENRELTEPFQTGKKKKTK